MPYETRSRTGKSKAPTPLFDALPEPAKPRRKKTTDGEPKTTKKAGAKKGASKSSKSSESSTSNPGTLRGRPKELPVLTEDEEEVVIIEPERNPMEKHRKNYMNFRQLFEVFGDGPEDEELNDLYDNSAIRTRGQIKKLQELKDKHKDDPQAVLAKTPLGRKMIRMRPRDNGEVEEDEPDLFNDSVSEASSTATAPSKTPTSRKLRPRNVRKSLVVTKSPWRKPKVGRAKGRKGVKKMKKPGATGSDAGSSVASSVASSIQSLQEEILPPQLEQRDVKRPQKRPVEEESTQKSIFVPRTDFNYAQNIHEPATKKRILAPSGYKYSGESMDKLPNEAENKKSASTKSDERMQSRTASSASSSPRQMNPTKFTKPSKVPAEQLKRIGEEKSGSGKSSDTKSSSSAKTSGTDCKGVPPKKIKKLSKTDKIAENQENTSAGRAKADERKPSSEAVRKAGKNATRDLKRTEPVPVAQEESESEPELFSTPTYAEKVVDVAAATTTTNASAKKIAETVAPLTADESKQLRAQAKSSTENRSQQASTSSTNQKLNQLYNATYVVSEDEVMQTPPSVRKISPQSQPKLAAAVGDATFVVPTKKLNEQNSSHDSPATYNSNATFVVPASTSNQTAPKVGSHVVVVQGQKKNEAKVETELAERVPEKPSRKETSGSGTAKKPLQREISHEKLAKKPVSGQEKASSQVRSSKEKLIQGQIRNGTSVSSTSSGESVASSKAASVVSAKSKPTPIAKLVARASPVLGKVVEQSGIHVKPLPNPDAVLKNLEEKQKNAEAHRNQFIQQKKVAQEKKNEEWKQKMQDIKRKEEARQAAEEKTGKVDDSKGGYVKNIVNFFKMPGAAPSSATKGVAKHLLGGALAPASSCPDVSKPKKLPDKMNKLKDVGGSMSQLPGSQMKQLPCKPSPKKPAAKPTPVPTEGPVSTTSKPIPSSVVEIDFLEKSTNEDSFATANADTTMEEVNENGKVNTYEITIYEDLDENMRHRENKRIPDWAADEDQLNLALFLQQPDLINLMRKPIFPPKNVGFKIFPNVPS